MRDIDKREITREADLICEDLHCQRTVYITILQIKYLLLKIKMKERLKLHPYTVFQFIPWRRQDVFLNFQLVINGIG